MSLSGFFKITRPANSVVAGFAAIIAYLIATGTVIPAALLLFVIVLLVTAAGNAINDYFDAEIDAINRPYRPIPAGDVSRVTAHGFAVTLFLAGILISFFTNNLLCIGIAIFNSFLLFAYAARLKSTPFMGNVTVSYLTASIFLFGGAFAGWEGFFRMVPISSITFLAMLARELLKDAEDVEGDKAGGASTLPIRLGINKTARIACVFSVLAAASSFVPYVWWRDWYLIGIIPVDFIIITATLRTLSCERPECVKASKATTILKAGMFVSLVVFLLSAILL